MTSEAVARSAPMPAAGLYLIGCSADPNPPDASAATMGFKAHNLLRMAELGLPVPPACVLGTVYCGEEASRWAADCARGLTALEARTARRLGDARRPLLLSVRSGAPVSMPGMMETLLNVGLCDRTLPGLLRETGNPRLAWDAYRRLVATYGEVVYGVPAAAFEAATQDRFDGRSESELDFTELRDLTRICQAVVRREAGREFPQDPHLQLQEAVAAVYASWQAPKAREYRRLNQIDDAIGTAVTLQTMVFGNGGGRSGAGVGFTRHPATGEPGLWVDFLFRAQGEDVVSGRRRAHGHDELATVLPDVWGELVRTAALLEQALGDMQDIEFTVEDGRLYMLQTRGGKRTPLAAARIALDLMEQGVITREAARERVAGLRPETLRVARVVGASGDTQRPAGHAASACTGVAAGEVAFTAELAAERAAAGASVILVRRDAETADLAALEHCAGLLTERGARTSHAAVVARQLGKVCLVGCDELRVDTAGHDATLAGAPLRPGDLLSLDGNTGAVYRGAVDTVLEEPADLLARMRALTERMDA